jgi:hypothetical protein
VTIFARRNPAGNRTVPLVLDQPSAAGPSATAAADIRPLLRLLDTLRRQTRRWIWIESLALVCLCGAAVFWGSLLLDWAIEPPAWVRASLAAAVLLGLAWLLLTKLFMRLARPLADEALALVVERAHGGFRDSLSTAIELAGRPREGVDQQLLARTTAEAVGMLGAVRPESLFRRRRLWTLACAGAAAAASIGALAVARPAVADLWTRRMVFLGDQPWPRRVSLVVEGFPGGVRKAARGGDVDVIVRATAGPAAGGAMDGGWVPAVVDLRSRGAGGWKTERMGMRGGVTEEGQAFGHVLKAVNEDLVLEVRGGDARVRNLRLEVVEAPALAAVEIGYTLPAYLGGGRRQAPASRIVQVPRGSDVEIVCRSTKPLSAATMRAVSLGGPRPEEGRPDGDGTDDAGALLASLAAGADGPPATSLVGTAPSLDGDRTIVVRLTDTDGLVNREPITFVLSATPDEPPRVAVRMRGISNAVTAKARIPLEGSIADDHGLTRADVLLRVADRPEVARPIARLRAGVAVIDLPAAAPEIVPLEPLGLEAGNSLGLAVTASDACTLDGRPNAGTSDVWSLTVVTPEVLMAMLEAREIILRRRYESCIADFSQARDRFQSGDGGGDDAELSVAASRLGEATSRAAGETAEIAMAFRDIRMELDNNLLLTPELDARLIAQIADPLTAIAVSDLPAVGTACRKQVDRSAGGNAAAARVDLVRRADEVLVRMRAVLDRMMELESFNEVIELLRGVIRTQEEIKAETLQRQKKRAREALEQP